MPDPVHDLPPGGRGRRGLHRERPTQVARIDSTIRRPSRPQASSCQTSRPVAEEASVPSPLADGDLDVERGEQRLQVGRRDPLEGALARVGVGREEVLLGAERALVPGDPVEARPGGCRGGRSRRPGRGRPRSGRRAGRPAAACGSPPPGGVEPDVGDLLARADDPPQPLAGRDGVGQRGRPRRAPDGLADRQDEARLDRPVVARRGRRWSSRAGRGRRRRPARRPPATGAGSFQRASTRTWSRRRPARPRAMIWRTAHPLQRRGLQLQQLLDRRRADRLDDQARGSSRRPGPSAGTAGAGSPGR